jgi:3-deoxy-D-manno-octulosonate 8-phosphate phosphatase (KDO 8-P phosphatase)
MQIPKIIFTDIDGVWTDGGMYYNESGEVYKKFNTSDSAGVLLCHALNIPVVILTGENSKIVEARAKKLNVDYCFIGVKNKLIVASELTHKLNVHLQECAYIGDDINDIELLKSVGFSGVVKSSPDYIKKYAHYITQKNGGEGAFREFVEHILIINNKLEEALNKLKL